jgi:myo-inositol-1(or 4)-monophosphatase
VEVNFKNMQYAKELKIVKNIIQKAGETVEKEFIKYKRSSDQYKAHDEIVTWLDKKSESIILVALKKHFPHCGILSEESGLDKKDSSYFWIVDPLDGTSNFTIHNPLFTVSVSLVYQNEIVLGITYVPILNELYWAVKDQGAYCNNKKIKVSEIGQLKKSFITYCHGQNKKSRQQAYELYQYFHEQARDCRHFGTTTLELAMVAAGHTESLIVAQPKLWDIAAGIILVQEAGGKVTDWQGKAWTLETKDLLACNQKMYKKIQTKLKSFI